MNIKTRNLAVAAGLNLGTAISNVFSQAQGADTFGPIILVLAAVVVVLFGLEVYRHKGL